MHICICMHTCNHCIHKNQCPCQTYRLRAGSSNNTCKKANMKTRCLPSIHTVTKTLIWHAMHTHKPKHTYMCTIVVAPLNATTLNNHHLKQPHRQSFSSRGDDKQPKPTGSEDREEHAIPQSVPASVIPPPQFTLLPQIPRHLSKNVVRS